MLIQSGEERDVGEQDPGGGVRRRRRRRRRRHAVRLDDHGGVLVLAPADVDASELVLLTAMKTSLAATKQIG